MVTHTGINVNKRNRVEKMTEEEVKALIQELRDEIPAIHAELHHDHCRVRMHDTGKEDAYQLVLKDATKHKLELALKAVEVQRMQELPVSVNNPDTN